MAFTRLKKNSTGNGHSYMKGYRFWKDNQFWNDPTRRFSATAKIYYDDWLNALRKDDSVSYSLGVNRRYFCQ